MSTLTQWDFTAPFEGVVPHLYKCTAGVVTWGVGFTGGILAARRLPWSPQGQLDLDWIEVESLPAGKLPSFYRARTSARLSDAAMRAEFQHHVQDFEQRLIKNHPRYLTYPHLVRIALLDMAFNLGVGGLLKFKKLLAACERGDWDEAAVQCVRRGIQAQRNESTQALFENCALDSV